MKLAISSLALLAALLHSATAKPILDSFYLVTTSQRSYSSNSSTLADVSATSLFDPLYQPNYLLRLIDPGYGSLPVFAFGDRTLQTTASGPHGIGTYVYNSTTVEPAKELQFLAAPEPAGNIGIKGRYLLTVNGEEMGWSICDGPLDQSVVSIPAKTSFM